LSWRPYNETPADLEREEKARLYVSDQWGVEVTKLSEQLYGIDWVLHRGKEVVGFGEFKYRLEFYNPYMISLAKYLKLRDLADSTDTVSRLVVQWMDKGTFMHRIHPGAYRWATTHEGRMATWSRWP